MNIIDRIKARLNTRKRRFAFVIVSTSLIITACQLVGNYIGNVIFLPGDCPVYMAIPVGFMFIGIALMILFGVAFIFGMTMVFVIVPLKDWIMNNEHTPRC